MGGYIDARNEGIARLIEKVRRREELAILNDSTGCRTITAEAGPSFPPKMWEPCPENIGNDPCDDQQPYDDDFEEEY